MPTDPTGLTSLYPRQIRGLSWKTPVAAAATGNVNLASPGATIDGVTMVASSPRRLNDPDRFLAPAQTDPKQNGIYRWLGATAAAVRDYDQDQDPTTDVPAEEIAGSFVYVVDGTTNGGKVFRTTNLYGDVFGTDDIDWSEFSPSLALALDDMTDVTITSPAAAQRLRYSGSLWVNKTTWYEPQFDYTGSAILDGAGNPIMVEVVS